jgi:hypothetical protein
MFHKRRQSDDGLSFTCKPCASLKRKERYARNKQPELAKMKEYAAKHRKEITEYHREWRSRNGAKVRRVVANWQARNKEKMRAMCAERTASRLLRTTDWNAELTDLVFEEAYTLAAMRATATGFSWEVDHEVPMRGKLVSGLHVWNNAKVIPKVVNRMKSNRFEVTV